MFPLLARGGSSPRSRLLRTSFICVIPPCHLFPGNCGRYPLPPPLPNSPFSDLSFPRSRCSTERASLSSAWPWPLFFLSSQTQSFPPLMKMAHTQIQLAMGLNCFVLPPFVEKSVLGPLLYVCPALVPFRLLRHAAPARLRALQPAMFIGVPLNHV